MHSYGVIYGSHIKLSTFIIKVSNSGYTDHYRLFPDHSYRLLQVLKEFSSHLCLLKPLPSSSFCPAVIVTLAHILGPLVFSLLLLSSAKHNPDSSWLSILDIRTQASDCSYRKTQFSLSLYHCESQVPASPSILSIFHSPAYTSSSSRNNLAFCFIEGIKAMRHTSHPPSSTHWPCLHLAPHDTDFHVPSYCVRDFLGRNNILIYSRKGT